MQNESQKKEQSKTLDLVNQVKTDLRKYRQQFQKNWLEEEDAYFGRIWKYRDGYRPYENHIFQMVESELPILSDSYPRPATKVKDPMFIEQAANLDKAVDFVLRKNDFQRKLVDTMRFALISGTPFMHTYYDHCAEGGEGRQVIEILPWKQVFLSGMTPDIDTCEKARIDVKRSRTWLKMAYPSFEDEIEKVSTADDPKSDDNYDDGGREKYDTGHYALREKPKPYKDKDTLTLTCTYIKDYSMESIPEDVTQEELAGEAQALMENNAPDVSKYQDHEAHLASHDFELAELYGQVGLTPDVDDETLNMAIEQAAQPPVDEMGNPVLDEMGQPVQPQDFSDLLYKINLLKLHMEEHGEMQKINKKGQRLKYPSGLRVIETIGSIVIYDGESKHDHNQIPIVPFYCYRNGSIYNHSEVRNTIDSQRMQAVMQFKEYKGLQRVANPTLQIDLETGLTEDDITNEDGGMYFIPQGTSIRQVPPGQVSTQIGSFNNDRINKIQQISGINEATQGEGFHPNQSGEAIDKIQQQAIGRIRLKSREMANSMRRLGLLIASDILQFWTTEKTLYLEDSGTMPEQVIFNPLDYEDLIYEIEISEGSMAGVDKDAYNAYATRLLGAGHITFEQWTDLVELPRVEKLKEFAVANNEQQAQLQQIQEQSEALRIENMKLKAQISPEFLTPEEKQELEMIQLQEDSQQLVTNAGANQGQPVN